MSHTVDPNDPAHKAANAARLIGIIMAIIGALLLLLIMTVGAGGSAPAVLVIVIIGAIIYVGPAIALLVLSGPVRRGSRGATIATLVIAILLGAMMLLSIVGQALGAGVNLFGLVIAAVLGLSAILLAVYCVQSLKYEGRVPVAREFEPVIGAPPPPPPPYRR